MVAGPASRKTSAAPGFNPFSIKAAAIGVDDVAQTYMGMLYANGLIVEKDNIQAFEWFLKGAKQGYSDAQQKLGSIYYYGIVNQVTVYLF